LADGDRRRDRNTGHRSAGRSTKDLVKRLGPDDIAVIDHRNLDRIAAEELRAAVRARLSVYGEFRSISSAIERVPLLERLDSLGRAS
jgi:uncharacterized membrane-anchored protein